MSYATQADIEAIYGVSNVASWSNVDNTAEGADTDRITWALEFADNNINARFRGSCYAVPLVGTDGGASGIVKDWAAKLAAVQLYQSRGLQDNDDETKNKMTGVYKEVHKQISKTLAGMMEIDAYHADTMPTAPVVCQ